MTNKEDLSKVMVKLEAEARDHASRSGNPALYWAAKMAFYAQIMLGSTVLSLADSATLLNFCTDRFHGAMLEIAQEDKNGSSSSSRKTVPFLWRT